MGTKHFFKFLSRSKAAAASFNFSFSLSNLKFLSVASLGNRVVTLLGLRGKDPELSNSLFLADYIFMHIFFKKMGINLNYMCLPLLPLNDLVYASKKKKIKIQVYKFMNYLN